MTVQQMLNSLPVLQRMMELKLPIAKAYQVYSLAKQINEQRDFFINKERDMIIEYKAELLDNGNIRFNSAEDQVKFITEHSELMNCEIENLAPIELSFTDLGDAQFTPLELMQLEGAVNFI